MVNRWAAAAAIAVLMPAGAVAQPARDSAGIVRAIQIRRYDIFEPSEATSFLPRLANGLHFVTREGVVRRELLFRSGQPYDSA